MASIASMVVWMAQEGADVEVLLVLLVVASMASMVVWMAQEGADVEVSLCLQW